MTSNKLPPTVNLYPVCSHPVIPRVFGAPAPSDPHVLVPVPRPIPWNPDIPSSRCWFRDHLWRRRSDGDRESGARPRVDVTRTYGDGAHDRYKRVPPCNRAS